jgi:transcription elongation factor GreA-like protein
VTAELNEMVQYRDGDGHPLIRFDGLKMLIVHCHRERETQVIKDICKEAIRLETFACRGITGSAFLSLATQWPDFSCFSTLKTLKGRCGYAQLSENLLLGLCEKLQMFPQPNVLETLNIEISVIWDRRLISK